MILKLKRTPGIYLVGFMGCGKTTVGQVLARELGWHFVDSDDKIEELAGRKVTEIFGQSGERQFRKLEAEAVAECVRRIESGYPTVVALGGGAFTQQSNRSLVMANGVSIWLDCDLETLKERVGRETHRPLARDPVKFADLYQSRLPTYRAADYRVDASAEDPQPVMRQILSLLSLDK